MQQIAQAVLSTEAYQGPIYGILSNNYGDFTSAGANIQEEDNPMSVALVGRVPVNVVSEGGSIQIGDFLTTSSTPGAAMKATEAGRVIGMALSSWDGESETVMIQVLNTWYQPPASEASELQGGNQNVTTITNSTTTISVTDSPSFTGIVLVRDKIAFGRDMVGQAEILIGFSQVDIAYETPFTNAPIVTISPRGENFLLINPRYTVTNESLNGFTIMVDQVLTQELDFNWHAFGGIDAQVFVSDGSTRNVNLEETNEVIVGVESEENINTSSEEPVVEEGVAEEEMVVTEDVEESEAEAEVVPEVVEEEIVVEEEVVVPEVVEEEAPAEEPQSTVEVIEETVEEVVVIVE